MLRCILITLKRMYLHLYRASPCTCMRVQPLPPVCGQADHSSRWCPVRYNKLQLTRRVCCVVAAINWAQSLSDSNTPGSTRHEARLPVALRWHANKRTVAPRAQVTLASTSRHATDGSDEVRPLTDGATAVHNVGETEHPRDGWVSL